MIYLKPCLLPGIFITRQLSDASAVYPRRQGAILSLVSCVPVDRRGTRLVYVAPAQDSLPGTVDLPNVNKLPFPFILNRNAFVRGTAE